MNTDMLFYYAEQSKKDSLKALLFKFIRIDHETLCYEWVGKRYPSGYGRIAIYGEAHYAHRLAWELENGEIPRDENGKTLHVCHKCDNPRCINTDHMFIGTAADNMADRERKGRGKFGPNRPSLQKT